MKDASAAKMQMAPAPASLQSTIKPELAALAEGVSVNFVPRSFTLGCEIGANAVAVDARIAEPARNAVLHFALEFALWSRLDRRQGTDIRAAHALAAAHAAGALTDLFPRAEAKAIQAALPTDLACLIAVSRGETVPTELAELVAGHAASIDAAKAWAVFTVLKPLAKPAVALMLRDGDNRLELDPDSGCNRYGGSPLPRANVIEFSSSTTADISPPALAAAEAQRQALMEAAALGRLNATLADAAEEVKLGLLSALGIETDGAVVPVLAASGTTALLLATQIALNGGGMPPLAIVVGPDESGRGVPAAVTGRHPAPCAPTAAPVAQNETIAGMPADMAIMRIPIRNGEGRPLPPDSLAEPIAGIVARERSAGRRVILHVLESSKTGLVAPGIGPVLSLRRWFPDLPIVVDACQLRTGAVVLRRYLEAGCMVSVSGSKFMGGPPFSGALLVPAAMLAQMSTLPQGFSEYTWRSDWPVEADPRWDAASKDGNPGLLLRWRGALAEMNAFVAQPVAKVAPLLDDIGRAVRMALLQSAEFALLPAVSPTGDDSEGWTTRQTIFAFAVRPDGGNWLDEAALRRLHIALASDVSARLPVNATAEQRRLAARICHIGQPVAFSAGPHPAALRIAIGARRIVAVAKPGGMEEFRRDLDESVAKLRLLLELGL